MRKKAPALAALAAPLIIIPAVLQVSNVKGNLFGLSREFWSGFMIGLGIVLVVATLAAMFTKKRGS